MWQSLVKSAKRPSSLGGEKRRKKETSAAKHNGHQSSWRAAIKMAT